MGRRGGKGRRKHRQLVGVDVAANDANNDDTSTQQQYQQQPPSSTSQNISHHEEDGMKGNYENDDDSDVNRNASSHQKEVAVQSSVWNGSSNAASDDDNSMVGCSPPSWRRSIQVPPEPLSWSHSKNELCMERNKMKQFCHGLIVQTKIRDEYFQNVQSIWKSLVHLNYHNNWISPTSIQLHSWSILLSESSVSSSFQSKKNKNISQHKQQENGEDPVNDHNNNNIRWNMIQISPTGSGKTMAYGVPAVVNLLGRSRNANCNKNNQSCSSIIIIVPTRELVLQVKRQIELIIKSSSNRQVTTKTIRAVACYGGVNKTEQERTILLQSSTEDSNSSSRDDLIIIATPGRLLDLISNKKEKKNIDDNNNNDVLTKSVTTKVVRNEHEELCSNSNNSGTYQQIRHRLFTNLSMIILDEADRLAMNGDLQTQVNEIINLARQRHQQQQHDPQMVLCSATWPKDKVTDAWEQWIGSKQRNPCAVIQVDSMALTTKTLTTAKEKEHNQRKIQKLNDESVEPLILSSTSDSSPSKIDRNSFDASGENPQPDLCQNDHDDDASGPKVTSQSAATETTYPDNKAAVGLLFSKIPSHLSQTLHVCSEHKKPRKLIHTIQSILQKSKQRRNTPLGLIFCSKIKTVQFVWKLLRKENLIPNCAQLHSHLNQDIREKITRDFTCGKTPLLIATDIASRGIHVNRIEYVINYDFPGNIEQYIHRCGRAGRSGGGGITDTTTTTKGKTIDDDTSTKNSSTNSVGGSSATIYSFFTRALTPMAPDMIRLLESTNQWVDPNLRALVIANTTSDEKSESKSSNHHQQINPAPVLSQSERNDNNNYRQQQCDDMQDDDRRNDDDKSSQSSDEAFDLQPNSHNQEQLNQDDDTDNDDDDPFLELPMHRNLLKRALNVSDASSDSSDDDEDG